jgi:hypothetical protein
MQQEWPSETPLSLWLRQKVQTLPRKACCRFRQNLKFASCRVIPAAMQRERPGVAIGQDEHKCRLAICWWDVPTEEATMKLKAIALASAFAMSSTLAFAGGVGSVELPVWASPSDISGSHFNLGNVAPGNPAVQRMQRAAPHRSDHRLHREARRNGRVKAGRLINRTQAAR